MGLNLHVYDLHRYEAGDYRIDYRGDERFDFSRHWEDRDFVAWLNAGNAVFEVVGPPDEIDSIRRYLGVSESGEPLAKLLERLGGEPTRQAFGTMVGVLERPKDFAAARTWVRDHKDPDLGDMWDKQRLLGLLDLLESNENLWIFESG